MLQKVSAVLKTKSVSAILLLLACIVFVFIVPAFEFSNALSILIFALMIFLSSYGLGPKITVLGIVAIILEVATRATDLVYLHYFAEIVTNLFIIFIVGHVIKELMTREEVTIYTLIDAINGYLLLGIMFISVVAFCDQYIPGSYNAAGETGMELVYYTFITLTTLGYGDVTPQLPIAQSLSMLIAVTGQFYVAVIVAILVGKYASSKS